MKKYISKIVLYAAAALALGFGLTSCKDEPDKFELASGKPTIHYIRPINVEAADSLLTGAYMGNGICIVGDNLRSVYKMLFNDQAAVLNNSYITDHTILVDASMAIFQAPFNQRPDLLCDVTLPSFQAIAARSIGQHGCIASVKGTEHVVSTTNDAPRHELVFRID